jgi:hypothetical protein
MAQGQILEFVFAQCKLCTHEITEVRVLDFSRPNELRKVLSLMSSMNEPGAQLQACSLFKEHLTKVNFEQTIFITFLFIVQFKSLQKN